MTPDLDDVHRIDMPRPDIPAYLTASSDEPIGNHLIDGTLFGTGYGFSADRMVEALEERGGVETVVIEHADSDHFGALPQIVERFDPEIVVPHDDQGFLPRTYYGLSVDRIIEDGDEVAGFRAISIPGHTLGNTSFVDESRDVLVAGDSVVGADSDIAADPAEAATGQAAMGQSSTGEVATAGEWSGELAPPADVFNRDTEAAWSNLDALAGLDVEAVLLTHGDDLETGGREAIDALLADLGLD